MQATTLALAQVSKQFTSQKSTNTVLCDISYSFVRGTTYAMTGASGSGKSTILALLSGIQEPTRGALLVEGKNFASFSAHERQQFFIHTVGCLFQKPHLIRELSVGENVAMPALLNGFSWDQAQRRAAELLATVGLADTIDATPSSLSGGQQQRVALARALANNPSFLLADEPTGNLDAHNGNLIIELLLSVVKKNGMGLIICTHDQSVAARMDQQLRLSDGILHTL